jgi:hypothetical protein
MGCRGSGRQDHGIRSDHESGNVGWELLLPAKSPPNHATRAQPKSPSSKRTGGRKLTAGCYDNASRIYLLHQYFGKYRLDP